MPDPLTEQIDKAYSRLYHTTDNVLLWHEKDAFAAGYRAALAAAPATDAWAGQPVDEPLCLVRESAYPIERQPAAPAAGDADADWLRDHADWVESELDSGNSERLERLHAIARRLRTTPATPDLVAAADAMRGRIDYLRTKCGFLGTHTDYVKAVLVSDLLELYSAADIYTAARSAEQETKE